MKRSGFLVLLIPALLLAQAGAAFASSHKLAPPDLDLVSLLIWELQHFVIHLNMTMQALMTFTVSPQLGFELLDTQTLCALASPLTGLLFGSAASAVATLLIVVGSLLWALFALVLYTVRLSHVPKRLRLLT